MTVLDTFYLLFKTDASGAKNDVAALDKQVAELAAKGKKRSEDETKQLKELRKQRQEALQDLKDQRRETDKLGDSFQSMVQGAVGAATAYASFGALKSGLIDANKLNASLAVLARTTGQNAGEIKAWGAALELAGGKAEDVQAFVSAQASVAAQGRTVLPPTGDYLRRLHNEVKNRGPIGAMTYLQQLPGGVALAPLLGLPDDEFEAAVAKGEANSRLRAGDEKAALENQQAFTGTRQAFNEIFTEVNTHLLPTIKSLNQALQDFLHSFRGHPNLAIGAGVAAAGATGWGAMKGLGWLRGWLSAGGATTTAAAGLGGAGLAAFGATAASGVGTIPAILLALGAGGYYLWNRQKKGAEGSSPVTLTPAAAGTSRQRVLDFWLSQGYSPGAAAGWAANAQAESSFNPLAVNGSHVGLYQWEPSRRKRILAGTGIDVATASAEEQLRAAAWEARTHYGLGPGGVPDSSRAAAALISNKYEVPALNPAELAMHAAKRADIAASYGTIPTSPGGLAPAAGGQAVSVKIDDVNIHTQATDAGGIAREVSAELKNQIRMTLSNFDDGVLY